jgi:flagellar M-ring protein FliF
MGEKGEKIKEYWTKFLEEFKKVTGKVSKKVWIAIAAALVLIAVVITVVLYNQPYAVLFTGLSSDEASTIMTYLDDQGVTGYRLENGDTILVPKSQETSLKAALLMEGYPKTGFSYSTYYDNVSSLSTESERNRAYLQDLQDRMAATIRCMDGVKDAVVTISQGEDHTYVLDSGNVIEASAAVTVTMKDNQVMSDQMAEAIRTLVSRSVQGLEIDNVSIVDTLGNTYNAGNIDSDSDSSALKLQLEEQYNNKIRSNVMQVLIPLYGENNVKVGVNCTVDVSYSEQNSTNVYLPDWANDGSTNGAGIIGSRVYEYTYEPEDDTTAGGVVGTESNSDISTYVEEEPTVNGTETKISGSGQIDYDNSRDETYTKRTAGYITDCTISVTINSTTAGTVDTASIRDHVARAAGISAVDTEEMTAEEYLSGKISVLALPFYEETESNADTSTGTLPFPNWVLYAGIAGLLVFILLLVVILVVLKKRKKKKQEQEAAEALANSEQQALEEILAAATGAETAEPQGADVMSLQTERSMELRKSIRRFVDENPELAAQMLKIWLRGGDDNG